MQTVVLFLFFSSNFYFFSLESMDMLSQHGDEDIRVANDIVALKAHLDTTLGEFQALLAAPAAAQQP